MADTFLKIIDAAMRTRVWDKFKDQLGVTQMNLQSAFMAKSVALRHISEKQGNVQLPFMNIWRSGLDFAWDRQRSVLARKGISTGSSTEGSVDDIRTVPVTINYNVWLWSRNLDAINSAVEKYMFWIHQDPGLDLLFNDTYPLEFDLHFGTPVDESPIDAMYDKGLYFVMNLPIVLDGWIFESSFVKIIEKIFITGLDYTVDPDGVEVFSSDIYGSIVTDSVTAVDSISKT